MSMSLLRTRPPITVEPDRRGVAARLRSVVKYLLRYLPRTRGFDRLYMLIYFIYVHRRIPRRNSKLYNDYLFFLLTGPEMMDPLVHVTTDKVYAKYFIDRVLGRKATPQTYAVFESLDQIRRHRLPASCVLKPAHSTGIAVILEDADTELTEADLADLRRGLRADLYESNREVHYRYLRKRIVCEELVEGPDTLKEYKIFCYRGNARMICVNQYWHSKTRGRTKNFYDLDWNRLEITHRGRPIGEWEERPEQLDATIETAEKLAQFFECVRVDLYLSRGRIYVGELTHSDGKALGYFGSLDEERLVSRLIFG